MRILSTLILLFTALITWAQAPVNDDCSGIIDLGEVPFCSNPAQYTNVGATASNIDPVFNVPACFASGGTERDVWFQFTVPADGSILDVTVQIFGNENGNGTLQNPQVAVYRGDCVFQGLAELDCKSASNGTNSLALDLFGLTPGLTYFLRINDYSASATPNAGTFRLCVIKYVPEINIGTTLESGACTGTLFDSGGAANDYAPGEDLTFTICPQDAHQCIVMNVETYATFGGDDLRFYIGDDITGTLLTQISGNGQNFEVQIPSPCATIRFTSDDFLEDAGFKITWACSPSGCTTPPITTCADPDIIAALPYTGDNLSNCFSGNSVDSDPCGSDFLGGNDYLFSYTSPGDECIQVSATGTSTGVGLGVYDNCPTLTSTNCIAASGGLFGPSDPLIQAAFLENAGTYYIMFSSAGNCTQFNISVDTVTCPILLPPASTCDQALDLGGCSSTLPEIIALNPGSGDIDFIQQGVNQGCFVAPQQNYAFFYFVAGADGKFGFTVEAADPAEASDIDLNVWGPIDSIADICEFTSNNQPVRSTWAAGADPTGLADIHPVDGTDVTDDFDCGDPSTPGAGGDDFVRRLDVIQGKVYVIMLDDFGEAIENGGIAINFNGTTEGVIVPDEDPPLAYPDTAVCIGQSVQLYASGGVAYSWGNEASLSCNNCPDPIATPTTTTTYQVQIVGTCKITPKTVNVEILDVNLGPDVTVCDGASFVLNPNPFEGVEYTWQGGDLSCANCPSPVFTPGSSGLYIFICTLTTPLCSLSDTLKVIVIDGLQPQYVIAADTSVCAGQSVSLGGNAFPATTVVWSSVPGSFTDTTNNPVVMPVQTTLYYISATNDLCPIPSIDSVLITVNEIPQLAVIADTAICQGQIVTLGTTVEQDGVTYSWTASTGTIDTPNAANPAVTPQQNTVYNLTASNASCTITSTVAVGVVPIFLQLNIPDTVRLCQGKTLNIQAIVSPAGTPVTWTPASALTIAPNGLSASAQPFETTEYTVTAAVPGCVRTENVYVAVDSLPENLDINPSDTTICIGERVLLTSQIYEPGEYQYMDFTWSPGQGQLTPDSLYNMLLQPTQTTIYRRLTQNGACLDTAFAVVQVIIPPPIQVVPPNPTICPGESVQLTAIYDPAIMDVKWAESTTLSCTECAVTIANPSITTTYTISGTYEGCPTGGAATVTVLPPPGFKFPDDTALCFGESVVLNTFTDANTTYSWTSSDPNFVPTTNPQPTVTPTQTTTYTLVASNGCTLTSTLTITVADAQLTVSGDTTICKGVSALLSASGTLPGSFLWSTGEVTQAISVAPTVSTVYTVIYTYGDGCTKTDNINVSVSGEIVGLNLPLSTGICPGGSILLNNAPVVPGATYVWTASPPDPTLITTAGAPIVAPTQNTTYTVTATQGLCVSTGTVNVTAFNATLTVSNDITLCAGESVTLTATGSGTGNYTWSTGTTSPTTEETPAVTTTYSVQYKYGNDCIIEESVTVTVVPNFTLSVTAAPPGPVLGLGESLELNAVINPNTGLSGYQFVWEENGVKPIGTTQTITTVVSTNDTTIRYIVTATSQAGCEQVAEIKFIIEQPVVEIPNAFTPDNDGTNDSFSYIEVVGKVELERMEIYNRWGQRVFDSKKANTSRWDGKVDGKEAPVDVYIYKIAYRKGDGALQPTRVGEISLIR